MTYLFNSAASVGGELAITGGAEITMDTVSIWQQVDTLANGTTDGLTFQAGITDSITAFADAGGGQVTVTAADHGLSEGDYVSISGTTSYNGLFQITNVATNTFEITDTWVADDATGTVKRGAAMIIPAGLAGTYAYSWDFSMTSAGNSKTYEFTVIVNSTTNGVIQRKIGTGSDVGAAGGSGRVDLSEGDQVVFGVRNITDATNMTLTEGQIVLIKT